MAQKINQLPLSKLAKLEPWMVPPSRKKELDEYLRTQRKSEVEANDKQYLSTQTTKPGQAVGDDGNLLNNSQNSHKARERNNFIPKDHSIESKTLGSLEDQTLQFLNQKSTLSLSSVAEEGASLLSDIDFFLALYRIDDKEHFWLEKWSTTIKDAIAKEKDLRVKKEIARRGKEEAEEKKHREQKIYEDWLKSIQ